MFNLAPGFAKSDFIQLHDSFAQTCPIKTGDRIKQYYHVFNDSNKTRLWTPRTIDRLRSENPNVINHFANLSFS